MRKDLELMSCRLLLYEHLEATYVERGGASRTESTRASCANAHEVLAYTALPTPKEVGRAEDPSTAPRGDPSREPPT